MKFRGKQGWAFIEMVRLTEAKSRCLSLVYATRVDMRDWGKSVDTKLVIRT